MTIVSLLPEADAILAALDLASELAALPDGADASPPALADALATVHPRLIFTSETVQGGGVPRTLVRRLVRRLRPRPAVYALEPRTLGDILSDIKTVGDATGQQRAARALIESLRARIDAVTLRAARRLAERPAPRVALLTAPEPPTAAGWWLAELIGLAGGHDVLSGAGRPPRVVTPEEIEAARPDAVLTVGGFASTPVRLLELLAELLATLPTKPQPPLP